jgi:photosystem II stability/assembly factor-like uncharacterized protein
MNVFTPTKIAGKPLSCRSYRPRMKSILAILCSFLLTVTLLAQVPRMDIVTTGTPTSLRGLSVVNDNVVWVSGSNGTVGRSLNGGKNWKWIVVKGFEKAEFRDIEAFDGTTALIMAVAEPAYILKTSDGGDTWKIVYENRKPGMFLDAMDFVNNRIGIVVGDPVKGKVFLARTEDTGNSWRELDSEKQPVADSGEAFFAASGSNIRLFYNNEFFIVSGGSKARLFMKGKTETLDMVQGWETAGAYAIDIFDNGMPQKPGDRMVIVGGDYKSDSSSTKNCLYSTDGGKEWKAPKTPPHGYRSCVEFLSKKDILACGPNGIDFSGDGGKNWKWISKEGFHVCKIARIGTAVYLAGENGKVARINWE